MRIIEDNTIEEEMKQGLINGKKIEELNEGELIDNTIFDFIFSTDNNFIREDFIIKIQLRAKQLKIIRTFNNKLKLYKEIYVKSQKGKEGVETNFKDCPYPKLKCGKWVADDTGIYKKEFNNNMQSITIKASPIPITIVERIVNIDTNIEKVKIAFFKDGRWQEIIVEKNAISTRTKILQLANRGLEVYEDNAKNLITYFADILELNNIPIKKGISHLGWKNNEFIPYSDEYCLDIEHEFKQKLNSIKSNGDYELWKKYIKELRSKSVTLRFILASSFASVLAKIFNINTFIVHLWGKSSNGKTVAEMVGASIWGKPDNNLINNLLNTTIANERLCNFYRNMPIFLDELQIAKSRYKSFDELIYILTEGKGKERGTVDNGLKELTEWQTIIMMTGEEPITSDVSKEGVKNRVIELNEDDLIIENGNETVNFIQENYGDAGKEFINLIKDKEKIRKMNDKYVKELSENIEYKKQINAFSIIMTADYIVSQNIFEDEQLTIKEISHYFRKDTDETERIYNLLLDWFYQNINKFNNTSGIGEIWGKYETSEDEVSCIYVIIKVLKDFLTENNINFNGIKRKMWEKEYIERNEQGEFTHSIRVNGTKIRCIKINVKSDKTDMEFEEEYKQEEMQELPF